MPKSEKELAAEKEALAKEKEEMVVEEQEPVVVKKVVTEKKKTEEVFVSSFPIGGKEYTDELHAWELAHEIKAVEQPQPPKE